MTSNCFRLLHWMILVLVLLLTACTSVPSAPPTSSPAASPTRSLPSPAALPSPSPSAMIATPTPQPTPGPDVYRLKAWTEQDAFDAILDGEKDEVTTQWELPTDRLDYLLTLEREPLLRFPESERRDQVEWKMTREAMILGHATYSRGELVDDFVPLLEKALDAGRVTPDTLEAWLSSKGFDVVSRLSAPSLFGDGQLAQVVQIKVDHFLFPSVILLTISELQSGNYRLTEVRPSWWRYDFQRQAPEEITIVNHNGNDRPEIQALANSEGRVSCGSKLNLYEWKGDNSTGHFENIAEQVRGISGDYWNSECRDPWEFGMRDARGAQPLTATLRHKNWAGDECSEFEYKIRYEWDGAAYHYVSGAAALPDRSHPRKCLVGWAHAAAKFGLYDQAIPLVASALADWPKELDSIWGPSAQDLFRFRLGTWYIFQGNDKKGVSTFQDVIDNPINRAFDMIPRMAEKFLSNHRASKGPDQTCFAVSNWLLNEFEQTPDNFDFESSGRTIPAWGFGEPDWLSRVPTLWEVCDRGWRPDISWDLQVPMPTPEPPPLTPEPTETPSPEQTQEAAIDLIEKTLFTKGDARQAAQQIERLLAAGVIEPYTHYDERYVRAEPYLRYLLGLSYELAGDERRAVDNYWHVWHDYPNSLYSKIAQQKLERIAP